MSENSKSAFRCLRFFIVRFLFPVIHKYTIQGILSLMSIAAISTNGDVPGGGPYYILSRTLGPYIGGSIGILYYFGLVALSALHSFGAGETLHLTFESFHVTTSKPQFFFQT